MDFWSGVTPACSGKDNESESIIYDQFPMIALDLYHAEGQVLTLSVAPQQYLRPVASDEKPDSDCYKVAVASSTTGTVIGKHPVLRIHLLLLHLPLPLHPLLLQHLPLL